MFEHRFRVVNIWLLVFVCTEIWNYILIISYFLVDLLDVLKIFHYSFIHLFTFFNSFIHFFLLIEGLNQNIDFMHEVKVIRKAEFQHKIKIRQSTKKRCNFGSLRHCQMLALRQYIKNVRICSIFALTIKDYFLCFNFKSELSRLIWNTVRPFSQKRSKRDKKHIEKQVFVPSPCIRMEVSRIGSRHEVDSTKGLFYQYLQHSILCAATNLLNWEYIEMVQVSERLFLSNANLVLNSLFRSIELYYTNYFRKSNIFVLLNNRIFFPLDNIRLTPKSQFPHKVLD